MPRTFDPVPSEIERASRLVVDAAFRVHSLLGPGLLEHVYELCLAHELDKKGVRAERQVGLPIAYDGLNIDAGYRMDLLVEGVLVVEIKSVESLLPVHEAQLLTYLKLSKKRLGLLINFNVRSLKSGLKRIVL